MLDIETLSDEELDVMQKRYERIREEWQRRGGQNPGNAISKTLDS
jgi:hypothetical protein